VVAVGLGVTVAVEDEPGVNVTVGVVDAVGVAVGLGVAVAVEYGSGVSVTVAVADAVGVAVGLGVVVAVEDGPGVPVTVDVTVAAERWSANAIVKLDLLGKLTPHQFGATET
jgi:hypothetical protein